MEKGFLKEILRSEQTVFTFTDLLLLWNGIDATTARKRVSYYIKTGDLYPIRRGLYAKDGEYNLLELATKIYTPAYISFETVLSRAGVIFQYYSQVFVASYQSRELTVDGNTIVFRTLKDTILTNTHGLENQGHNMIATPERAFLDIIYLSTDYHFDQLSLLDWEKINSLLSIYGNTLTMRKKVEKYRLSN